MSALQHDTPLEPPEHGTATTAPSQPVRPTVLQDLSRTLGHLAICVVMVGQVLAVGLTLTSSQPTFAPGLTGPPQPSNPNSFSEPPEVQPATRAQVRIVCAAANSAAPLPALQPGTSEHDLCSPAEHAALLTWLGTRSSVERQRVLHAWRELQAHPPPRSHP